MTDFILQIRTVESIRESRNRLREQITLLIDRRFDSPPGYILLGIVAAFVSFAVTYGGVKAGTGIIALCCAVPVIIACLFHIRIAVILIIAFSFFLLGIKRFIGDVQLGVVMDAMVALMFFGLFIRQIYERNWGITNNAVNKLILAWIAYNVLQFGNPFAESRLAWVYTVRTFAGIMIMYYLLMSAINSRQYLLLLVKLWIGLSTIAMLYGYKQEFIGLFPFEEQWITSVPERYALLFQAGKYRKFSIFSDPLVYGFMMAITSILCFLLAQGPISRRQRVFLYCISALMMYGMLFSGTRAAFILPLAAFAFYAVISFKKKIFLLAGVFGVLLLILINIPTSDPNLVRFQSAFNPSQDASYQVRVRNQAFIKPYIQTHPLGGGLGSVGEWGKKFSPWSPLANFPPDSGFVRTAVEQGWLGLLLYCSLLFAVFRQGIQDYFRIRDPLLKSVSLAMLTVLFSLTLANFPQEAIGQYPINLLFFVAIAIINKSRTFDTNIV